MTLPASSSDGRGYLDSVNVYPKNIQGDEPKSGKDVKTLGNNILPAQIGKILNSSLREQFQQIFKIIQLTILLIIWIINCH